MSDIISVVLPGEKNPPTKKEKPPTKKEKKFPKNAPVADAPAVAVVGKRGRPKKAVNRESSCCTI